MGGVEGVGSKEGTRREDGREDERRIQGMIKSKKFQVEEISFHSNFSVLCLERMLC